MKNKIKPLKVMILGVEVYTDETLNEDAFYLKYLEL